MTATTTQKRVRNVRSRVRKIEVTLLDTAEVARIFGRGVRTVRRWCRDRKIPAVNIAAPGVRRPEYRINLVDVEAYASTLRISPDRQKKVARVRKTKN